MYNITSFASSGIRGWNLVTSIPAISVIYDKNENGLKFIMETIPILQRSEGKYL
jgi:hypothetical protein